MGDQRVSRVQPDLVVPDAQNQADPGRHMVGDIFKPDRGGEPPNAMDYEQPQPPSKTIQESGPVLQVLFYNSRCTN